MKLHKVPNPLTSSSEWSKQSPSRSHLHFCGIHFPLLHINWSSLHFFFGQFNSSLPSPQSWRPKRNLNKITNQKLEMIYDSNEIQFSTYHCLNHSANATMTIVFENKLVANLRKIILIQNMKNVNVKSMAYHNATTIWTSKSISTASFI